jgi:hypothetical protein
MWGRSSSGFAMGLCNIGVMTTNKQFEDDNGVKNMKKISAFSAMRFAGVTREHLRSLPKKDRILAWMMVVMTVETARYNYE